MLRSLTLVLLAGAMNGSFATPMKRIRAGNGSTHGWCGLFSAWLSFPGLSRLQLCRHLTLFIAQQALGQWQGRPFMACRGARARSCSGWESFELGWRSVLASYLGPLHRSAH